MMKVRIKNMYPTPIFNCVLTSLSGGRQLFGWIHVISVVFSFLSIFVTTISFNEIESQFHSVKGAMARIAISIPFFLTTLVYRGVGIALCIVFLKYWSGVIIFL